MTGRPCTFSYAITRAPAEGKTGAANTIRVNEPVILAAAFRRMAELPDPTAACRARRRGSRCPDQ